MSKLDKARNLNLINQWLEYNRDNFLECAKTNPDNMNDEELIEWLKNREYGKDRDKISFELEEGYLTSIRYTMRECARIYLP